MRPALAALVVVVACSWAAVTPALAQHATAVDIEDGARAFQSSCATCHGPDGDQVAGIHLGRGEFRRPLSDDDLVRIIRNGIPDTPMPATRMSEEQARRIVAYLRDVAASGAGAVASGDAGRGRALFEGDGGCLSCHRVAGRGARVGPDLSAIGRVRRAVELEASLLDPAADVQPANRFYRVVTADGATVTGRLLNHDTFTVQLIDGDGRLRSLSKAAARDHGFVDTPMPSYRDRLSPRQVSDLVSYLATLRGGATP
jgi:putative heme-binding domain-containing protein